MPEPTKPDDFLYRDCTPEVKALVKQAKKELRAKRRELFARQNGIRRPEGFSHV